MFGPGGYLGVFKDNKSSVVFIVLLFLLVGTIFSTRLIQTTPVAVTSLVDDPSQKPTANIAASQTYPQEPPAIPKKPLKKIKTSLHCFAYSLNQTCPTPSPPTQQELEDNTDESEPSTCPDYFRWIHEDLKPWAQTGISRDMVERANRTANFRLVIVNGTAYVETYAKGFQTRDVFTVWGILQLLRRYPGNVPDLDLMFDCVDWPVVRAELYSGPDAMSPPPLFTYCSDNATLDLVFPDWSFWGWPETNIKPWESLSKELKEGNKKVKWLDREAYAYWKGNPTIAETRQDLMKCNASETQDWNARLYQQDWVRESQDGYKKSDLASQCIHRYKIYIEGSAWSVSEKYILACDSMTLLVRPLYYDFFTRGLMPLHHYWPIRDLGKCKSIKYAVEWGNSHEQKAETIGQAASNFIQDELKMDFVYDYMFHLFTEYAKLLTYKPTVPPGARKLCAESMVCDAQGLEKKFMLESLVKGPSNRRPCKMPPPYDPASAFAVRRRKADLIRQVEMWEDNYWEGQKQ